MLKLPNLPLWEEGPRKTSPDFIPSGKEAGYRENRLDGVPHTMALSKPGSMARHEVQQAAGYCLPPVRALDHTRSKRKMLSLKNTFSPPGTSALYWRGGSACYRPPLVALSFWIPTPPSPHTNSPCLPSLITDRKNLV